VKLAHPRQNAAVQAAPEFDVEVSERASGVGQRRSHQLGHFSPIGTRRQASGVVLQTISPEGAVEIGHGDTGHLRGPRDLFRSWLEAEHPAEIEDDGPNCSHRRTPQAER